MTPRHTLQETAEDIIVHTDAPAKCLDAVLDSPRQSTTAKTASIDSESDQLLSCA